MLPSLENSKKTIYLLFFSYFSMYITFKNNPFNSSKLNLIEKQSNMAALLTIFSGSLYSNGVEDSVKLVAFIAIVIINSIFMSSWIFTVCGQSLNYYQDKMLRFCPKTLIFLKTLRKTIKNNGVSFDLKNLRSVTFREKYQKNLRSIRQHLDKEKSSLRTINENEDLSSVPYK